MIRAKAVIDDGGGLLRFEAIGHAELGPRGSDIVCAAVSILARTAYKALAGLPGVELGGEAPLPGILSFELLRPATSAERAAGVTDFLVAGMSDLAREYPDALGFQVERDWRD